MIKKFSTILAMLMIVSLMAACGPTQALNTPLGGTNPPETNLTETTVVGTASASSTNIDELIALVNQYVASGDITGNAENGLLAKLDTIKQKMMNGQGNAAGNELGAFVNEVQAQQGKKISDAAASALIAKAQQVAVALQSSIPVTGATATSVSSTEVATSTVEPAATGQPTSSSIPNAVLAPTPMGEKVQHQGQWDKLSSDVAKLVGFTTFTYDVYKLPANSTWQDTLAYYDGQAATAGWGATHSQTGDIPNGHFASWSVVIGGINNYFVVVQVDSPQGTYTLNVVGK